MTVSSDLKLALGPKRFLTFQIDGLEPIFIQEGTQGYTSDYKCFRPPGDEWSMGLNFKSLEVTPSSIMVELGDMPDPTDPTISYFGKLFAPGAWSSSSNHVCWLKRPTSSDVYLDADAASIRCTSNSGFASSGTIYMGQETITYTSRGTANDRFSVCTKGKYPCVGTNNFGYTYAYETSSIANLAISSVPYSWLGRRCSIKVVTWDESANDWHNISDAKILWVGRITDPIRFDPNTLSWQLGCEHILVDLETEIVVNMPQTELKDINLRGVTGRSFRLELWDDSGMRSTNDIEVPINTYTISELLDEINGLVSAGWVNPTLAPDVSFSLSDNDIVEMHWSTTYTNGMLKIVIPGEACHPLSALGFNFIWTNEFTNATGASDINSVKANGKPFESYHPLSLLCNGGYLEVKDPSKLWDSQGDENASVTIKDVSYYHSFQSHSATYTVPYTAKLSTRISLDTTYIDQLTNNLSGFAGARIDEDPCYVTQAYVVDDVAAKGPFEMMLYPLLSTGTNGYNDSTYDKLPLCLSVGMDTDLVDKASFKMVDHLLNGSELAVRSHYVIDSPITYKELLQRECMLFSCFLAWDMSTSKLTLKRANGDVQNWIETIDSSVRIVSDSWEIPAIEYSRDTVVNVWECKIDYDRNNDKYGPPIVITDENSKSALKITSKVTIEHPGISKDATEDMIQEIIRKNFDRNRYPWGTVTVALPHSKILNISIGDKVKFVSTKYPDPFGTGAMSMTCMADVVNISWNLKQWIGKVTLVLNDRYDALTKVPWGASALVDKSATNSGWNETDDYLTLVAHQFGIAADDDDGAAFVYSATDNDYVLIVESAPSNLSSPTIYGPYALAQAYDSGNRRLYLSGVGAELAACDTDKEY